MLNYLINLQSIKEKLPSRPPRLSRLASLVTFRDLPIPSDFGGNFCGKSVNAMDQKYPKFMPKIPKTFKTNFTYFSLISFPVPSGPLSSVIGFACRVQGWIPSRTWKPITKDGIMYDHLRNRALYWLPMMSPKLKPSGRYNSPTTCPPSLRLLILLDLVCAITDSVIFLLTYPLVLMMSTISKHICSTSGCSSS